MHQFNGFGDLRLNNRSGTSDTTLWPSFTDIMTVILMVFMLTMVVVIVKNAYLAERLSLSQIQQSELELRLESSRSALADIRVRATDLEEQLRTKEMEIILLGEEAVALQGNVDAKLAIIDRLRERQVQLEENIRLIRLDLAERDRDIAEAELRLDQVTLENRQQAEDLNDQIAALMERLDSQDTVMLTLTNEKSNLELDLARQRQEFSSLEDKYLKLIRPARSAMGKMVATVRYAKVDGQPYIGFKGVKGEASVELSMTELYERLDALKQEYGETLYVKIVIPDDSGLSYNAAWSFTKDILSRYDYYYREGWPDE